MGSPASYAGGEPQTASSVLLLPAMLPEAYVLFHASQPFSRSALVDNRTFQAALKTTLPTGSISTLLRCRCLLGKTGFTKLLLEFDSWL